MQVMLMILSSYGFVRLNPLSLKRMHHTIGHGVLDMVKESLTPKTKIHTMQIMHRVTGVFPVTLNVLLMVIESLQMDIKQDLIGTNQVML